MKKLIALMLALVMAVSFTACGGSENGGSQQEEEKVKKNPVRSELYEESGTLLANISYVYDENGMRVSNSTAWVANTDVETDTYTYDENGNVIKKVSTYSYSPDYEGVKNYYYDEDGKLIKEDWGSDDYGIKYEYDENGHLKTKLNFNAGTETVTSTFTFDESTNTQVETEVWDDWTFTYTTKYNADGEIEKWDYAVNGEVLRSHHYEYDTEGNLTKQGVSIESWKLEGYVVHYYE